MPGKSRVEFTHVIDGSERVIAFIDYTPVGPSFGTPRISRIDQTTLGGKKSDNLQRFTVHKDGRGDLHLVDSPTAETPFDGQVEALAKWSKPRVWRDEQTWVGLDGVVSADHLPKAKVASKSTETIRLNVGTGVTGIVALFGLMPNNDLEEQDKVTIDAIMPEARDPRCSVWIIDGGFPYTVVAVCGLGTPRTVSGLSHVGRDYRARLVQ
ncbi:MAG: hypothetical protein WD208_13610 [Dehalococcoidia bacterium]